MNSSAIHQAIHLYKQPKEMSWICQSDTPLATEITALLHLFSSDDDLKHFSNYHQITPKELQSILHNFIEQVLLNNNNPPEKVLGLNDNSDVNLRELHYQLLLDIFNPDNNTSFGSVNQTTRIIDAYQHLKQHQNMDEFKNIRISHVPVKNSYTEIHHADQKNSSLKNTILIVLAITFIGTVWLTAYQYSPSKQKLALQSQNLVNTLNETQALELNPINQFSKTRQTDITDNNQTQLHRLLSNIEEAYEQGNATKIQLLLNTPEIKEQSDEEVFKKLENLFQITSKRKMLLYNFEWKTLSGKIYGKGKFLSRYHLNQAGQWLTREGIASIQISKVHNKLDVISLKLDNNVDSDNNVDQ